MKKRIDVDYYLPQFANKNGHLAKLATVKLSRILDKPPINGVDIRSYQIDGIRYLRVQNIRPFEFSLEDVKFVQVTPKKSKVALEIDDILITRKGTYGVATLVTLDVVDCIISSEIILLRLSDDSKFLAGFVVAWINSQYAQSLLTQNTTGQMMGHLTQKVIADFPIPVIDEDIQRALVADLDQARATRKSKLAEAEDLLKGMDEVVMRELGLQLPPHTDSPLAFSVRLGDVLNARLDVNFYHPQYTQYSQLMQQSAINKVTISELSPQIIGGATPNRDDDSLYTSDGIRLLRILNVAPYELNSTNVNYISEEVHNGLLARSQLQVGDVLMTITGRVGTCAIVTEDVLPANINQHIVILRINNDLCLTDYFVAYMNSEMGKALSNRPTTGGTRIALDYQAIGNLELPLPSIHVQQRIVDELHTRMERARQLRQEADAIWYEAQGRFEHALLGE